jgi:hypothetical protein
LQARNLGKVIGLAECTLNPAGSDVAADRSWMMKTKSKIVRWGALAILVAAMSGCCVAPWGYGGRGYYGHGYYDGPGWHRGG